MTKPPHITVDHSLCVGSDLCTHTAPATFAIDADGYAEVIDPAGDPLEAILVAAHECPVHAIEVRDGDGGEPLG